MFIRLHDLDLLEIRVDRRITFDYANPVARKRHNITPYEAIIMAIINIVPDFIMKDLKDNGNSPVER
jgi:hypothetical protein